jgi:dihydroflavonol-4-reductase
VLVTGATGFLASHCITSLLRAGYGVRGTVRDPAARAEGVRAAVRAGGADPANLSFAVANLDTDTGWADAMAGCSGVLHLASPFPVEEPKRPADVIGPAREGTLRILRAARDAGVRRVVLTSSVLAVTLPLHDEPGHIYDERDWSDPERPGLTAYMASKTLAERAAWDFVRREGGGLELAVVNPALVLGPPLDAHLSASLEVLRLMARGSYPAVPRARINVCDVRDVAEVHLRALADPAAAGERFLVSGGTIALLEIGRVLAEVCPDLARRAPRWELPDWAVRAAARVDARLRAVLLDLGAPRLCSVAKAERAFGMAFRSPAEAARAAAESMRRLAVI